MAYKILIVETLSTVVEAPESCKTVHDAIQWAEQKIHNEEIILDERHFDGRYIEELHPDFEQRKLSGGTNLAIESQPQHVGKFATKKDAENYFKRISESTFQNAMLYAHQLKPKYELD